MHRFTWWFQLRFHLLLALFSSNLEEEQISGSVTFFYQNSPAMSTNQIGKHINIFVAAQKTKTLSLSLSLQIRGAKCNRLDFTPCRNCGVWLKFPYFQEGCPHCTAKRLLPGLVNFFPAVVYLFCLNLPAAFMQTGQSLSYNPCTLRSTRIQGRKSAAI